MLLAKVLNTRRFCLTPLVASDEKEHMRLYTDPQVMHFVRRPMSEKAAKQQFDREMQMNQQTPPSLLTWSIRPQGAKQFAGVAYIFWHDESKRQAEMGVMLLPEQQGRGIANEIIPCLLNYAFKELAVRQVWAKTHPANSAGCKTLQKSGFKRQEQLVDTPLGLASIWIAVAC